MYTQDMLESIKKVEATRAERLAKVNAGENPRRMTADEKDAVLAAFHPDYITSQFETLKMGPNKGEKVPLELAEILQANSRINPAEIDLSHPDYDVDVLVIGGGGAGSAAAIMANENGANAMIVTKLRHGDANTMMAEGGIQAADKRLQISLTILPQYIILTPLVAVTSRTCPNCLKSLLLKVPTLSSG